VSQVRRATGGGDGWRLVDGGATCSVSLRVPQGDHRAPLERCAKNCAPHGGACEITCANSRERVRTRDSQSSREAGQKMVDAAHWNSPAKHSLRPTARVVWKNIILRFKPKAAAPKAENAGEAGLEEACPLVAWTASRRIDPAQGAWRTVHQFETSRWPMPRAALEGGGGAPF